MKPRIFKIFKQIFSQKNIWLFFFVFLCAIGNIFGNFHHARASLIDDLNSQVDQKRQALQDQQQQIKQFQDSISAKAAEATSLANELTIIGDNIQQTENQISVNKANRDLTQAEIQQTEEEIRIKQNDIVNQKQVLAAFIVELDQQDQQTPLEIWFKNSSFSEFLDQSVYIERLQEKGDQTLQKIQQLKDELDWKHQSLKADQDKLIKLQKELDQQAQELDAQKSQKEDLLQATQNDEQKFKDLMAQAKQEEDQTNNEITSIEQQIRDELSKHQDPNSNIGKIDPNKNAIFIWPVSPARGISTYFHDITYPFRSLLGEHQAIDIRAYQGTPVAAAADGYVAKVRNTGTTAFNYALLLHNGGYSTMYGHLTSFSVIEGQYVKQGDIIGSSGGTPGTIGAGVSTGAHLHFEVRKNGVPIDPLTVLP